MAKASKRERGIEAVRDRIVPVSEASPYLKLLLYGLNGKGKTRTAAKAPRPLIIDCNEEGTLSVRNYKGAEVFNATTWEDLTFIYWLLKSGKHKYKTVVIDTLTMMQDICTRHVLKDSSDRDPMKDPRTMSQREWGKLAEFMNPMLLDFRNLPMHVVFVAQQRTVDNDEEEKIEKVPQLSPKIRLNATSCVGVIGHISQRPIRRGGKGKKEKVEYHTVMLTGPHEVYTTKDRTGVLPRNMIDPSVNKIIAMRDGKE